ncbi:MAG: flagellar biosynthetic protein FliO [bacterium]
MRRTCLLLGLVAMLMIGGGARVAVAAPGDEGDVSAKSAETAYDPKTDPREQVPLNLDAPGLGADAGATGPVTSPVSVGSFIFSVILWLAICIGLIYGLAVLLKLFYRKFPNTLGVGQIIEPVASVGIAPGLAIHIVRLHDELLVLGATQNGVALLERVTDPERVALLVQAAGPRVMTPNPRGFSRLLEQTSQRMGLGTVRGERMLSPDELLLADPLGEPRVWVVGDDGAEAESLARQEKLDALRKALKELQHPAAE